ncbi:hypothetical protein L596_014856 [Steinernema carpocapsae]|uniref:CUB domain-containing protein n=1 Tax=Steinernema carpocapsae TaxID=34508 RepID=A0A4U5NE08_STECR|nr:hypothetical protein L596_014856 [Steinernema carpocapsae]
MRWKTLGFLLIPLLISPSQGRRGCSCNDESFSVDLNGGEFKSPGFPQGYCDDLNCVFVIEPKPKEAVAANIEHFATELLHDYLEVSQIVVINGTRYPIRQEILSGNELVRTFFTSAIGAGLRFRFVTDSSESTFAGFKISFTRFKPASRHHSACPQPFAEAQDEVRIIASPARKHSSCIVRINSTEAIKLNVDNVTRNANLKIFDTENFDYRRRNFAILKEIQGFATNHWPYEVISRTSSISILITFSESLSGGPPFFYIRYSKVPSPCRSQNDTLFVGKCASESLPGNGSLLINSPGYPVEYCDNSRHTITIKQKTCPTGHFRIKFKDFQMEAQADYIVLREKYELMRLSYKAKEIKYFSVCSAQSQFTINTVTDHSVTDRGYSLLIETASKEDCSCSGGPYVVPPPQPGQDKKRVRVESNCKFVDRFWRFDPPTSSSNTAYRFQITLEYELFGYNEFMEISYGKNTDRNQIIYRVTRESIMDQRNGTSNYELRALRENQMEPVEPVYIWYHRESDEDNDDTEPEKPRDISFDYRWVAECECGEILREAVPWNWNVLTSPDYPHHYCNDLSCKWLLYAPKGYHVVINITDIETEFGQDFLSIYNGNDSTGPHMELTSGVVFFDYLIKSTDHEMTIEFETDVSIRSRGFKILYTSEPNAGVEVIQEASHTRVWVFFLVLAFVGALLGVAYGVKRYVERRRFFMSDDSLIEYSSNLRAESQVSLFRT